MLYIGFSLRSHKILAQICCKKYKHCAPVDINGTNVTIYQFERINKIVKIHLKKIHLNVLEQHGWVFIPFNKKRHSIYNKRCLTCVQFTKQFFNIKQIKIQTPDTLFKYIK